ncbi:MAG: adenosine kinase [Myxococcota bacterium]
MSETTLDVLGIGNAMVDVLSRADDSFVLEHGLTKGTMALIDGAKAQELYAAMGPGVEASGGSAGNTIAGLAALGSRCAYVGRVRDDALGRIFSHDLRSLGVRFETPMASDGPETGRCLILVTPDAQRTMNTYLGACVGLGPDDIDESLVSEAEITYLEGYLFDPPDAKRAFRKAVAAAHAAGRKVALTLSDPLCVQRARAEFEALVDQHVDILFANELEIRALYELERFEEAIDRVRDHCEIAALTRSEKGSIIVSRDGIQRVDASPVETLVDSTGAGDLYAAGFLYGLTTGRDLATCGRLASLVAAEAVSHFGPRPERNLRELVAEAGLAA